MSNVPTRPVFRTYQKSVVAKTRNLFYNVCILCGTAVVLAITIKVILVLF